MPRKGGIFWFVFDLLAIVNASWWLLLQFSPDHTTALNFAFNAAYGLPYLVAAAYLSVVVWRWRLSVCPDGIGVLLIALACFSYGLGQFAWVYGNFAYGVEVPSPGLPDAGYGLSSMLLIFAGTYLLLHRPRTQRFRHWQSFGIVSLSIFASLGILALLYAQLLVGDHALFALDELYVGTGLVAAFTLLFVLGREAHGQMRTFLRFVLLAICLNVVASVAYGLRVASGAYWNGDIADGTFMLSGMAFLLSVVALPSILPVHSSREYVGPKTVQEHAELYIPGVFVAGGLLLALLGAEYLYDRGAMTVRRQTQTEVNQVAGEIQTDMRGLLRDLNSTIGFIEGSQSVEEEEFLQFLRSLDSSRDTSLPIGLLDPSGVLLFEGEPGIIPGDLTERVGLSFLRLRGTTEISVSDPIVTSRGLGILIVGSASRAAGSVQGVVLFVPFEDVFQNARELAGKSRTDSYAVAVGPYDVALTAERMYDRSGRLVYGAEAEIYKPTPTEEFFEVGPFESSVAFGDLTWVVRGTFAGLMFPTYVLSLSYFFGVLLFSLLLAAFLHLLLGQRTRLRIDLDRKSRTLNQFVSLVAHQLRAPMTQMRWMSEHLASHPRLPKDARDMASQIETAAERESRLVGDLLNVSRIERGILQIEIENVPLSVLAKEIAEPLLARADERGVSIVFDKSLGQAGVRVDRQKAVEAVRNILDNAVRYSPFGGMIRLFVSETNANFLVLAISDQGPGIPKEIRSTLFEIRLTANESSAEGAGPRSTGLGLYLTKQFLTAMGAAISYETGSAGTTFFIRFPRAPGRRIAPARSKR